MKRALHAVSRARRGTLALLATVSALAGGCVSAGPPWGERTKHLNRTFYLDGRADRCIVYRDSETPQPRFTLLFVHGLASSKGTWQFVAPEFEPDHRVILIDLLGHGDSSKPTRHEYSMSAQGDLVRKFIFEEDLRNLVIVGCSYGGGAALEAVLPLFRRGQAERIRGLVLIGAAALDFPPPPGFVLAKNPLLRALAVICSSPHGLARRLLQDVFWQDDRIPDELVREYARAYRQPGAVQAAVCAGLEIFAELRARRHALDRYGVIDCPLLLVWGDHDEIVPREVMHGLAQVLPQAGCYVVPACGHAPHEEQPSRTGVVIRQFLDALPPSAHAPEPASPDVAAGPRGRRDP